MNSAANSSPLNESNMTSTTADAARMSFPGAPSTSIPINGVDDFVKVRKQRMEEEYEAEQLRMEEEETGMEDEKKDEHVKKPSAPSVMQELTQRVLKDMPADRRLLRHLTTVLATEWKFESHVKCVWYDTHQAAVDVGVERVYRKVCTH